MNNIRKGVILDLDGTVYRGSRLIPGSRQTIEWLGANDCPVVYISNKPLNSRADYAAKLTNLGIPTHPEQVLHSSRALVCFLEETMPGATIYAIGEEALLTEISGSFRLSNNLDKIDAVVASFDRQLDYEKLNIAFQAIKRGARFLATNADITCPVEGGEVPDAGAVIAYLETCSGKKVEAVAGKPSPLIIEMGLKKLGLPASACMIVGDRLETDILMGQQVNVSTALVLTGVTTKKDLEKSPIKPDFVLQTLADLPELFQSGF